MLQRAITPSAGAAGTTARMWAAMRHTPPCAAVAAATCTAVARCATMRDLSRWLGLAAGVIVLDQLSKLAISSHLSHGEGVRITGFFNLVLAHNQGAAFSFLNDAGGWQRWLFALIAVAASVWIVQLLRRHPQQKLFCLALALVLGGALGN